MGAGKGLKLDSIFSFLVLHSMCTRLQTNASQTAVSHAEHLFETFTHRSLGTARCKGALFKTCSCTCACIFTRTYVHMYMAVGMCAPTSGSMHIVDLRSMRIYKHMSYAYSETVYTYAQKQSIKIQRAMSRFGTCAVAVT